MRGMLCGSSSAVVPRSWTTDTTARWIDCRPRTMSGATRRLPWTVNVETSLAQRACKPNIDRRLASEPSFGPSRRPVSEDFRGDDKVVDWARFRAVMSAWDAAHAPPGAVQNPFTNLPPS